MLFSELYSAYYNTMAKILKESMDHAVTDQEMLQLIDANAFQESRMSIFPAIKEERWQILKKDGTGILNYDPSMPLTLLERRWLKAMFLDRRVKLFTDTEWIDDDVAPLFTPEDYVVYDRYNDGDPYEDLAYIANFRLILDAIRHRYPLHIRSVNRNGKILSVNLLPEYLEYSEKDDKFRLIASGTRHGGTINLARIQKCEKYKGSYNSDRAKRPSACSCSVVLELQDRKNALERALLHFAHFEKQAERINENIYRITVYYDQGDETELVIRVLSFGSVIRVTEPESFVCLLRERLLSQMDCDSF